MPRIYCVKQGSLNESERLDIARLLIKAGYAVKLDREKKSPQNSTYTYFIEYWEDKEDSPK